MKTFIRKSPQVAEQLFAKLSTALRSLDLRPDFGRLNLFYEHSIAPLPSEHKGRGGIDSICRNAFVFLQSQMI